MEQTAEQKMVEDFIVESFLRKSVVVHWDSWRSALMAARNIPHGRVPVGENGLRDQKWCYEQVLKRAKAGDYGSSWKD